MVFARFSERLAEGRDKAQAASLRRMIGGTQAKKLAQAKYGAKYELVSSSSMRKGDVFLVEAGDIVPLDGEVIEGVALVDESAITGESAPVIRESGGERSGVPGGSRILSEWLVVKATASAR